MYTVNWPKWEKIINKAFIPLVNNRDRYLICYGGRGSSKSDFAVKKLIYRCLTEDYFRYILVRKTYNTIKDSSYQTLKDVIIDLGLAELFEFKVQPLEIVCKNGNKFIARGCDDPTKLKSVKDPTGVWWEEDVPEENDFITITTSVRTKKADYLQEIFTINPEVEGNYEDHWFWKWFFKDKIGNSFSSKVTIKIDENTSEEVTYTTHHSTYKHNRWIPKSFIAFLMDLKEKNPYYYTVYCLGLWGNRQTGGLFYKCFNRSRQVIDVRSVPGFEGKKPYNPDIAIHASFDFNVNPFVTLRLWQIIGKKAYNIDEICLPYPRNTTLAACQEFKRLYPGHRAGLFIYGDPSGLKEDTRAQTVVRVKEQQYDDYVQIMESLQEYRPIKRVSRTYPPVVPRGGFINSIFESNIYDIELYFHQDCYHGINDYQFLKEASDGTKHKEKVKDPNTGVQYEKYGHCSDADDYLICEAFKTEFQKYKDGNKKPIIISGKREYKQDRVW